MKQPTKIKIMKIVKLTTLQYFSTIFEFRQLYGTNEQCYQAYEKIRWPDGIPKCKCGAIGYRCGYNKAKGYICIKGHKFSLTAGTMFEYSKLDLHEWFLLIYLSVTFRFGVSTNLLVTIFGKTYPTRFLANHKLREIYLHKPLFKLKGIVECDLTETGGKRKNKHADRKGPIVKNSEDKILWLHMRSWFSNDRISLMVPNKSPHTILPILLSWVERGSLVMTDTGKEFEGVKRHFHHLLVDHGIGYAVGETSVNKCENFNSIADHTIRSTYHHASRKHQNRYIGEINFRQETCKLDVPEVFEMVLKQSIGVTLRLKDLQSKGWRMSPYAPNLDFQKAA